MGKPRKQHRKKKYNYNTDRRRLWKKSKKLQKFTCKEVLNAYDEHKSHNKNMEEMGLCMDPNKTLHTSIRSAVKEVKEKPKKASKAHVVEALETQAKAPQPRRVRLSEPEVRYCIYMMERYGEDYAAMARDPKNYYQDTANQIRRKIRAFMSIPEQYGPYMQKKAERGHKTPVKEAVLRCSVLGEHRRETRGYCASRRNGHYLTPPFRPQETVPQAPGTPSVSHAKRRLNFGRRPPRHRPCAGETTESSPPTLSRTPRKRTKSVGSPAPSTSSAHSTPSKVSRAS